MSGIRMTMMMPEISERSGDRRFLYTLLVYNRLERLWWMMAYRHHSVVKRQGGGADALPNMKPPSTCNYLFRR